MKHDRSKLREREAKARQKTRVLVFTELNRTAKQLEGKIGSEFTRNLPVLVKQRAVLRDCLWLQTWWR